VWMTALTVAQNVRGVVTTGVDRGAECEGSCDNFVPGAESGGEHTEVERGGAGVERDCVGGALVGGEVALELRDPGAGAEPAGAERGDDFLDFGFLDAGAAEDERPVAFHRHLSAFFLRGRSVRKRPDASSA